MHSNWRDCQAWKDENLSLSTTSNEAAKLYDAAITQIVGWYEIDQLNGLNGTLTSMFNQDPNFAMGHVLDIGLNLLNIPRLSDDLKLKFNKLVALKDDKSLNLTDREEMHIDAIKELAVGNITTATSYWENILIENPTDMLAAKFAQDAYFYMGFQHQARDSLSRIMPFWNASKPLYSYLYGMWSFGLVQTNYFDKAEYAAKKALELNKFDGWATHTINHLNEYRNTYNEGIVFLLKTESDWTKCNLLLGHNYWHLCLYYLERNEIEKALQIYDEKIITQVKNTDSYLDIVDACSLLYRLKLDNLNEKERWLELKELMLKHVGDNGFMFNDMHIFMCMSACNDTEAKSNFFQEFKTYLGQGGFNYLKSIKQSYGESILQAISYFDQNEFSNCVNLLNPIRYNLVQIGGSNAQRDILHQMLTISALRSDVEMHKKLGLALLNERKAIKPNSNITRRIAARFASVHEQE